MYIVRKGKKNTPYYYRYVRRDGERKRDYIGIATDPAVQIIIRNDRLRATESKLAAERRVADRERCVELLRMWAMLGEILRSWQLLELGNPVAQSTSKLSLTHPYPWQGKPQNRYFEIRRLVSEPVVAPRQDDQSMIPGSENRTEVVGQNAEVVAYQRTVFAAALDLLSICRDHLVDAVAADCPMTRAAVEAAINKLNVDNGFLTAASPVERLLIESISMTYFESMAFGALSFEDDHLPTHAASLANAANRATRRFSILVGFLTGRRAA